MAAKTEADGAKAEADETKGGGRKKLVVLVLVTVVALAAVYMLVLKPKGDGKPHAAPKPTPGAVVKLDPITVNLAAGHFLKLGLSLQASADAGEDVSGAQGARRRDQPLHRPDGRRAREEGRPREGQGRAREEGRRALREQGLRHLLHGLRHAVTARPVIKRSWTRSDTPSRTVQLFLDHRAGRGGGGSRNGRVRPMQVPWATPSRRPRSAGAGAASRARTTSAGRCGSRATSRTCCASPCRPSRARAPPS